jgi:hypothetical protein
MSTGSGLFSLLLFVLAGYNLSKLPWYLGLAPIPSYGFEASLPFHALIKYRGSKLWSHPVLFLAPHAVMGSTLLILYAALDVLRVGRIAMGSEIFFALAVLFAVHIIPERAGIPNRSKRLPLNEACIIIVLTGTALAAMGVVEAGTGRTIVIVPCLGAPILELLPVMSFAIKKIRDPSYKGQSKDGDIPLKRNMKGYSGICPFAKQVDISLSEYPSSSDTKEQ